MIVVTQHGIATLDGIDLQNSARNAVLFEIIFQFPLLCNRAVVVADEKVLLYLICIFVRFKLSNQIQEILSHVM